MSKTWRRNPEDSNNKSRRDKSFKKDKKLKDKKKRGGITNDEGDE